MFFKLFIINVIFLSSSRASDIYDCNEPLFDKATVKATSSSPERDPTKAKLHGEHAWTAGMSDFEQYLIFDLKRIMKITHIETQGRPHSNAEYVVEYTLSYGSNGFDYADYKDSAGTVKVFKGNVDVNNVKRNTFEVPIIAQWIRINPTRWNDRISMRVELYGCNYYADHMYFNGTALLQLNLRDNPVASSRDSIKFRFKTNVANGVLLYSHGTQGDFIAVQIRDNKLVLNIDLGTGLTTSLSVGSLLDDNIWHDVMISRTMKDILFSVDRVVIQGLIKGEFNHLNLDNLLYIGGVPSRQEGIIVAGNFTGCIENMYINNTNVIQTVKEAYGNGDWWAMQTYKKINTLFSCPEQSVVPITLLTETSHAKLKGYEGMQMMNSSFSFRTYETKGLLLYHKFISNGFVKLYLEDGKIKVQLSIENNPEVILDNYAETFNDGKWHSVILTIQKNMVTLNVDQQPMITTRLLSITTGNIYYIGGGVPGTVGLIGCMRMISIDGNYRVPMDWSEGEYCCKNEIVFDACQMMDRCNPNPCKHNGICKQTSKDFNCDCANTGYGGAVCHMALHPVSCEGYKHTNTVGQRVDTKIDVDGSGPLDPFPVTCQYYSDGRVITEVHHKNEEPNVVNGFDEPGSYKQEIVYEASMEQMEALVNHSSRCWQNIRYSCRNARLFGSPGQNEFRPYSWWVSKNNQKMDYWGGSVPGSRKCECGILGQCIDRTKWCNCDSGHDQLLEDAGDIKEKEYLPVKRVQFGDTGTPMDSKEGTFTLGPLMCEGDDLFSNVITFRIASAAISLPTFDFGQGGDIYFEFKTTIEKGVIIHSRGPDDFILVELNGGDTIRFTYRSGNRPTYIVGSSTSRLSDNNWHSVSLERNRKGARIVVDGSEKNEVRESTGPVRPLFLTSDLVIGTTVDLENSGFTGCMRAFMINGQLIDLLTQAKRGLYGVSPGCVGKCSSNPCLNNGTCIDRYSHYNCDCRWTSFKGPICADEIGVTLRDNSMIKYDFMGSWRSTIAENIRVGFTTTHPQGFLLGLFSNISGEYMTITVSNSGHLRIVFDFGFERQERIFPDKHFGLGQFHDVRIRRRNSGATLVLEVDDNEPIEYDFDIKESADAQFNNIQYLYIGKNESMNEGFVGCVSRVEFDDIYPLKLLFQQNGPANVRSLGPPLVEDFCGVEPITHPPDILETRPPLNLDANKVSNAYHETDSALVGGILFLIFLLSIVVAVLIGRYVARHKGDYITQEDTGAEFAVDSDTAVIHSKTGSKVQKKQEFFI